MYSLLVQSVWRESRKLLSSNASVNFVGGKVLRKFTMKTNGVELKTKEGELFCTSSELDLGITLKGGQSFRWMEFESGYRGVLDGLVWTLRQNETLLFYKVQGPLMENKDYSKILKEYFRLDMSLEANCKKWAASDEHFEKSLNKTRGVRILNQDVVENVFSFICSSNNNIQRISSMVEKMCTFFGDKIGTIDEKDYYSFPSIESLMRDNVEATLKNEKFGYRAGFIANAAKKLMKLGGRQWLLDLKKENNISYTTAREQLMTLPGIGPKVADCVCLMSLGHLEAIPIDTHIFQIVRSNYLPHMTKLKTVTPKMHEEIGSHLRELWGPLAGWAQAVVFCAKIGKSTNNETRKRQNKERVEATQKKNVKKR